MKSTQSPLDSNDSLGGAVEVAQCLNCGTYKIIEAGNHHPFCPCGSDNFDWAHSQVMPKADAVEMIDA